METPSLCHISEDEYSKIYEPAEDSFLLIDALECELKYIRELNPSICVEVGSGSGVVLTALGKVLREKCFYIATDINPKACSVTRETGSKNQVSIEAICTDLVKNMDQLEGKVDVLLFNPPYVVTPPDEVGVTGLMSAWAGGLKGREVMDRIFPCVPRLLSPNGVFYLLVIKENCAYEIEDIFHGYGFTMKDVLFRRAGREHLSVLKFQRNCHLER